MLILDLWGISFHAVVVFGLGKNLLFKSILGRCESLKFFFKFQKPRLLKSAKMSSEPLAQPELIVTGSIEKKSLNFKISSTF